MVNIRNLNLYYIQNGIREKETQKRDQKCQTYPNQRYLVYETEQKSPANFSTKSVILMAFAMIESTCGLNSSKISKSQMTMTRSRDVALLKLIKFRWIPPQEEGIE